MSMDDLSVMVIEKTKSEDSNLRKKRESYRIHNLCDIYSGSVLC